MDKNDKDLIDDQEGEIVLNESGTSVSLEVADTEIKKDKVQDDKPVKDFEKVPDTKDR